MTVIQSVVSGAGGAVPQLVGWTVQSQEPSVLSYSHSIPSSHLSQPPISDCTAGA